MTISKTKARLLVLETLSRAAMGMNWTAVLDQDIHGEAHKTGAEVVEATLDDQVRVYEVASEVASELADSAANCRTYVLADAEAAKEAAARAKEERAKVPLVDLQAVEDRLKAADPVSPYSAPSEYPGNRV